MASALYPKFKEALLSGNINMTSNTIKCILVDAADYTYNAAHQYYSSVPSAARVGTPQALGSKTVSNGVFDAADVTFSAVTGDPTEAVIIYKEGANDAASPLIAYIEGSVTPNGGDITVQWDNGTNKIFAL